MLSRHVLRIKLVQALFAYEIHRSANRQLAIEAATSPPEEGWNEPRLVNRSRIDLTQKELNRLFKKGLTEDTLSEIEEQELREQALKALTLYQHANEKDLLAHRKELVSETSRITRQYYAVLDLMLEMAEIATTLSTKTLTHEAFYTHPLINTIRVERPLAKAPTGKGIKEWRKHQEQRAEWLKDVFFKNPTYIAYASAAPPTEWAAQMQFILYVVRHLIFKGVIDEYLAEQDIRWTENRPIIKGMVEKMIKEFHPEYNIGRLPLPASSWGEDVAFLEMLFDHTIGLSAEKRNMIAQNTRSWEVTRLPLLDRVVLELAIAEMLYCPDIPVKVSIDEYVEIAKKYSTNNSQQFVNGILDTISKQLQDAGELRKSGRGLIDNK